MTSKYIAVDAENVESEMKSKPESAEGSHSVFSSHIMQCHSDQPNYEQIIEDMQVTKNNNGSSELSSLSGSPNIIIDDKPTSQMILPDQFQQEEKMIWKNIKIYNKKELELLSCDELKIVLRQLHEASQAASKCLVSNLQSRHCLCEEAEARNIAIEQLLRRAEKFSPFWSSNQASSLMTGRG